MSRHEPVAIMSHNALAKHAPIETRSRTTHLLRRAQKRCHAGLCCLMRAGHSPTPSRHDTINCCVDLTRRKPSINTPTACAAADYFDSAMHPPCGIIPPHSPPDGMQHVTKPDEVLQRAAHASHALMTCCDNPPYHTGRAAQTATATCHTVSRVLQSKRHIQRRPCHNS